MIQLTQAAQDRVKLLMSKKPQTRALRLGVKGGGCSGFSYLLDLDAGEPTEKDRVFEFGEVKVYVDSKSYFFLNGMELDFVEELMGQRFVFKNPNVSSTCGCGESVSF